MIWKNWLIVCTALLVLPSMAVCASIESTHAVELEDPAGDVLNEGDDGAKDIVRLSVETDGEALAFSVVLAADIAETLAGKKAGDVIQVNMDTDNDPSTGGKTSWGDKEGFEYVILVRACIAYENGAEVCVGGSSGAEESFFSTYKVEEFAPGTTNTNSTQNIFWESPRVDINGAEIVARVPYADIGVSSGDTIRMAIREADSTYDAASFFPEIMLTLK